MYLDTAAHSIASDYRFLIGTGKADARRALLSKSPESTSLHVWREHDGIHAQYEWRSTYRRVHTVREIFAEVSDFALGKTIAPEASRAIDRWLLAGMRSELALVFVPAS
jgi:hypothetical protein